MLDLLKMDPDAQVMLNAAFGLFPNAVGNPGNLSSPGEIFFVSILSHFYSTHFIYNSVYNSKILPLTFRSELI